MFGSKIEAAGESAIGDGAPRRVALFMFDFALTGVVRNGVRIANALAADGHDVHLIVSREDGRDQHDLDSRVRVVALRPAGTRLPRSLALAGDLLALRARIAAIGPQILASLGNHGHLPVAIASAGLAHVRRVYRISNELHRPGDGPLRRLQRRATMGIISKGADRLLLVSRHLARNPAFIGARERGVVAVVPNGVPADTIARAAASGPCPHPWLAGGGEPVVVAMGRLVAQKNFATLVEAVAIANRVRSTRLLILGHGTARARERLVAIAQDHGIADRVDLVGAIGNPFPYLRRATAFALPSLWEGASNALLEALACRVPIVASLTAGNAQEVLGHGRFGLLVEPMDTEAMAQAILWQTGPDRVCPGDRARDFDAEAAIRASCSALLGALVTPPPRRARLKPSTRPSPQS
ncbi:Glycosyltransferase involved in cell wall bisynthesis [Sphingomonas laterariae]|uniref:Glycosyltransferase involved in cell wall bisynthesis n=1 Tax=Edaphosphingomonas laterariae TaxID=861865 RepID=A0A239CDJ8_9SPHN|nr:glycosyltransferase [Sphingomonas laterariae]SNS17544.1 Glycosyltransferase involved in cell wall bisynthesis [Sphingomonas laterariae]